MAIFETHCHLNHAQFEHDYEEVLDRATESNVRRLLVVSYDLSSSRRAFSLSRQFAELRAAVGIHPEDADEWTPAVNSELLTLCRENPGIVVAWGEIGLDYHWQTHSPEFQKTVFIEQLAVARSLNLPAIIHCRDAYDDTLKILEETGTSRAVLHCFTGTPEQAQRAVELGCYIGIGGVVTYRNAENVRVIASETPLDRLLLETDSPFLAPQAWRGKRNVPAYITAVAQKVADVRQITMAQIEEATWDNATRLFG